MPTLQLKKKQLQLEIIKIRHIIGELDKKAGDLRREVSNWADVFAEEAGMSEIIKVKGIKTKEGNVAGIDLPVFESIDFDEKSYDFLATPLWVDRGLKSLKEMISLKAELLVYRKQEEILREELRIANQRVNLFEKVKIPQARENIRVIQISLGELRTAEVVRGKIAKNKIEKKREAIFT